ncbi:helix-turn-helix domain-containing protein [Xenorhabdus szentirmaii]|uniref:helix-turn-helix domain-containing protein n=1 Tax=Xenorhabdus szentirmaii TaxID=290112 RepID=UPI001988911D|nr:helix-turn-helix transcriptional regulator [Xenorhabdus sp. 38]MBD2780519.1 helix-turn-helix domain-containing protein [Xenorhabdus sp. 38]
MTMTHIQKDWHPAEIICALRKRGTTLAAVSREAGLSSSTLANTLEIHPSEIWPSRYFDEAGQLIERTTRKTVPVKIAEQ